MLFLLARDESAKEGGDILYTMNVGNYTVDTDAFDNQIGFLILK